MTDALGDAFLRLEHIGRMAIPGLSAKPVIDILAVTANVAALDTRRIRFEAPGYQVMGEFGIKGRRYFRKETCSAISDGKTDFIRDVEMRAAAWRREWGNRAV